MISAASTAIADSGRERWRSWRCGNKTERGRDGERVRWREIGVVRETKRERDRV